jgi:hypothetical protein
MYPPPHMTCMYPPPHIAGAGDAHARVGSAQSPSGETAHAGFCFKCQKRPKRGLKEIY